MKTLFEVNPWKLIETGLNARDMRLSESLTAIGNGYMGMRGNFEERYSGDSHRGTYLSGVWFPDKTRVGWWKNGYPSYFGKVINAVNLIELNLWMDGEAIDLAQNPPRSYRRELDMKTGVLSREFRVAAGGGALRVRFERFLSIARPELLCIRCRVTPERAANVAFEAALDGRVHNEDANYEETFWLHEAQEACDRKGGYLIERTRENPFGTPRFAICAAMQTVRPCPVTTEARPGRCAQRGEVFLAAGETLEIVKYAAVTTSRDYQDEALLPAADAVLAGAISAGYEALRAEQEACWARRWAGADVVVEGDDAAQQGIRFNIFQLLCTYDGRDARLNIGPKGFTGEKYGGATYWDTEAYCLPMYQCIMGPGVALNLLKYRFLQLEGAYHNARAQGLSGALFPMVTFNGIECHNEWEITFEEIHRNAAIALAIFNYTAYTGDESYLRGGGFDVLAGVARFWASRVHYCAPKGVYMIHGVTGPNEYENNVNNNWYTNRMAAWCLQYCAEVARGLCADRRRDLGLTDEELNRFEEIAAQMYLPADEARGIFVQHDTFLDKDLMPAAAIDPAQRPINQHWSWDRILRSCYIKQADVLQGLYALGHLYDVETKRRNFEFYEPMTVHESSLSPCVHAVLAAEIGARDKAVEMYRRTARLDLDDLNNDTKDGCHITSMAGSYLAICQGFAGMRWVGGLSFSPFLPDCWSGYSFTIHYRGRRLKISVSQTEVTLSVLEGAPLTVILYGRELRVTRAISRPLKGA